MTTMETGPRYRAEPGGRDADGTRLPLRASPLALLLSASPWRAAAYLGGYLLLSGLLFAVAFTATVGALVLAITLAGIPLLIGAAAVLRGCANVERARLRLVFPRPVRGRYRKPEAGLLGRLRTCWHDPATWRDLAYLIGLWVPLFALDLVVTCLWLTFAAAVTAPLWYWAPEQQFANGTSAHGLAFGDFPNGPHGPGAAGLFVSSLPSALLVAAVGLVLFLLFNYVLVLTARTHAHLARVVLQAPGGDPLAPARDVLTAPGPLGPLDLQPEDGPHRAWP